jgi:hypothetical protein
MKCLQAFNMFNDVVISVDGPINGYVVVFDMQGVSLRHLTIVKLGPLRNFMAYIQVITLVFYFYYFHFFIMSFFAGSTSSEIKENLRRSRCMVRESGVRNCSAIH